MGPIAAIDSRHWEKIPDPSGGAFSTARDVAVFGQTVLNGGSYGSTRILSRPSVAAMTRNQTPGVPVRLGLNTLKWAKKDLATGKPRLRSMPAGRSW